MMYMLLLITKTTRGLVALPPNNPSTKCWIVPTKGAPPIKQPPMNRGILSPIRGHCVFFFALRSLRKNSGRSQNISGTLQTILRRMPKLFWLDGLLWKHFGMMIYLGFSETLPVFSPKHFRCLRNFSGDFLSDS